MAQDPAYCLENMDAFVGACADWAEECFGPTLAGSVQERTHRFLEEALELCQASGCTAEEAHLLVDYVYGRPVGEIPQETGGVMVTLAALCAANGVSLSECALREFNRCASRIDAIREKSRRKPRNSPLPGDYPKERTK